jgi:hypothetical protein
VSEAARVANLVPRRAEDRSGATRPGAALPVGGPLVSVVINNYNYEQYLVAAVESALAQHYRNIEVIVVDDGSTDGSLAALAAKCDDPRLTVIEQANAGQAAAMNTGFAASAGDVVVFLDADDLLYPGAVPTIVGSIEPGVAKFQYRLDVVDGEGSALGRTDPPMSQRMPSGDLTDRLLARGRYITPVTSGNAFTRAALDAIMPIPVGPFRLCADGYLVYSTPFEGRVVSIERSLGAYRMHGANLWTGRAVSGPKLEQMLRHDDDKYRAIATAARRHGQTAPSFERRDHWHLRTGLALARTSPDHARPLTARLATAARAAVLTATDEVVAPKSRVKLAVWALAVAVAPAALASRLVGQLYGVR